MLRSWFARARSPKKWLVWLLLLAPASVITALCTFPSAQHTAHADIVDGSGDFSLELQLCTPSQLADPGTNDDVWVTFQTRDNNGAKAWTKILTRSTPGALKLQANTTFKFSWPTTVAKVRYLEMIRISKAGTDPLCLASARLLWKQDEIWRWRSTDMQPTGTYVPNHTLTGPIVLDDGTSANASFVRFLKDIPSYEGAKNADAYHRGGFLAARSCGEAGAPTDLLVSVYHDEVIDQIFVPKSQVTLTAIFFRLERIAHVTDIEKLVITNIGNAQWCYDLLWIAGSPNGTPTTIWSKSGGAPLLGINQSVSFSIAKSAFPCPLCQVDLCREQTCIKNIRPGFPLTLNETNKLCASQAGSQGSDVTCNGADEDCDGIPDDNFQSISVTCGVGVCQRTKQLVCEQGSASPCVPGAPTSSQDTLCNGLDDDCDGSKDEDYVRTIMLCGTGPCTNGGLSSCVNGQVNSNCTPKPPAAEICDTTDNDCDGQTNEGLQQTVSCTFAGCPYTATQTCDSGGTWGPACASVDPSKWQVNCTAGTCGDLDICRIDAGSGPCSSDAGCDKGLLCFRGVCLMPACADGVKGPGETGIDCEATAVPPATATRDAKTAVGRASRRPPWPRKF